MSKPGKVLKELCKKLGVRLTVKRNGKRVYKSIKTLKTQCKRKKIKRKRKFGKKSKKSKKSKKVSVDVKSFAEKNGLSIGIATTMLASVGLGTGYYMLDKKYKKNIKQNKIDFKHTKSNIKDNLKREVYPLYLKILTNESKNSIIIENHKTKIEECKSENDLYKGNLMGIKNILNKWKAGPSGSFYSKEYAEIYKFFTPYENKRRKFGSRKRRKFGSSKRLEDRESGIGNFFNTGISYLDLYNINSGKRKILKNMNTDTRNLLMDIIQKLGAQENLDEEWKKIAKAAFKLLQQEQMSNVPVQKIKNREYSKNMNIIVNYILEGKDSKIYENPVNTRAFARNTTKIAGFLNNSLKPYIKNNELTDSDITSIFCSEPVIKLKSTDKRKIEKDANEMTANFIEKIGL